MFSHSPLFYKDRQNIFPPLRKRFLSLTFSRPFAGIIATVWSSRNTPATATKDTPKVTDMMVPKASSNADDAIPLQIEEKIEKISDTKMDGSDNLKESRM